MQADEKKDEKMQELLKNKLSTASLDKFELGHKEALDRFEKDTQSFRVENFLGERISQCLLPLTSKVSTLSRLIDQIIANVDKHED